MRALYPAGRGWQGQSNGANRVHPPRKWHCINKTLPQFQYANTRCRDDIKNQTRRVLCRCAPLVNYAAVVPIRDVAKNKNATVFRNKFPDEYFLFWRCAQRVRRVVDRVR